MGKASRRKRTADARPSRAAQVPFARRPFEGLPGETEWVALGEVLPAATATVELSGDQLPEGAPTTVTISTVLPLAWPSLRRDDGEVLVATQAGSHSGDASRDLAGRILAAVALEPGAPLTTAPPVTADTPRLQDLLAPASAPRAQVHDGFDYWIGDQEAEGAAKESLERANESVVPTVRIDVDRSAFWCRIGERTYVRVLLAEDEDAATTALARLQAAGETSLGGETKLLGAFRTSGLLVPVWELDPQAEPGSYVEALTAVLARYDAALSVDEPLTADERRARSGLLSRQITLR